MNRGARKEPVFLTDRHAALFLDVVGELPARFGVEVHGYALMPNHFHLMVLSRHGNLSLAMRHLGAVFTSRVNEQHGWDGPIFKGRYRNRLVGDDAYWRHLLAYLHLNPVRAHLVAEAEGALWTSDAAYRQPSLRPPWLSTDDLLGQLGGVAGYDRFLKGVRKGREPIPAEFDPDALWKPPSTGQAPSPIADDARPTAEEVLDRVSGITGVALAALLAGPRGADIEPEARWLAMAACILQAGETHDQVARRFGVSRPAVSRALRKVLARRADPGSLRSWVEAMGLVA